jgi:DNA repair protein RecN (Recombination protein N)
LLSELKIKSFGIIDELTWCLASGLNIVTGETGAGKSLVIDAIESLLDGKLDEDSIRFGSEGAGIEGIFFLAKHTAWPRLRDTLEEKGVEIDEDDLVMSGAFRRQGRAVLRINGSAVNRSLMREVGELLVDIHGQSQHLSLFNKKNHLDFLDAYAHTIEKRVQFAESTTLLYEMQEKLSKMKLEISERAHRQEILQYQCEEIIRAKLKDGEEEDLEKRRRIISSTEKLKALAYEAYQALNGEDGTVALTRLNQALRAIDSLAAMDSALKPQSDALQNVLAVVEETARELRHYEDGLEFNPRELEEIENRLELLHTLKKKYGKNIGQILARQVEIESELACLASADTEQTSLEQDINKLKDEMGKQAETLTVARRKGANSYEKAVETELGELNMAQVRFEVAIRQTQNDCGLPFNGDKVAFNKDGVDDVEFMVSTNPGEPLKPLAAIASTGEVSRFTLALKVALAEADSTPVLVFDEIDIGIGGRSGDMIGKKLWSLARHHQVICVTHLPQIAVYSDAHYNVSKAALGKRTTSDISAVEGESRISELSSMLGGDAKSEIVIKNAREMAQKADAWKQAQLK